MSIAVMPSAVVTMRVVAFSVTFCWSLLVFDHCNVIIADAFRRVAFVPTMTYRGYVRGIRSILRLMYSPGTGTVLVRRYGAPSCCSWCAVVLIFLRCGAVDLLWKHCCAVRTSLRWYDTFHLIAGVASSIWRRALSCWCSCCGSQPYRLLLLRLAAACYPPVAMFCRCYGDALCWSVLVMLVYLRL